MLDLKYPKKKYLYKLIDSVVLFAKLCDNDKIKEEVQCIFCKKIHKRSDALDVDTTIPEPYVNFMMISWTWYWEVVKHICDSCRNSYALLPMPDYRIELEKAIKPRMFGLWDNGFDDETKKRDLKYIEGDDHES